LNFEEKQEKFRLAFINWTM